jgi:hypothetical protein
VVRRLQGKEGEGWDGGEERRRRAVLCSGRGKSLTCGVCELESRTQQLVCKAGPGTRAGVRRGRRGRSSNVGRYVRAREGDLASEQGLVNNVGPKKLHEISAGLSPRAPFLSVLGLSTGSGLFGPANLGHIVMQLT